MQDLGGYRFRVAAMLAVATAAHLASTGAWAQASGSAGTAIRIKNITVESGAIYIFADGMANPAGCVASNYVVVPPDIPKQEYFLSVALTAQSTGRAIGIWNEGCVATNWHSSAPRAVSLTLPSE